MHIIRFQGGLGNQLFQYALYTKFQQLGYETRADLSYYRKYHIENRKWILPLLSIQVEEAEKEAIVRMYRDENSFFSKVKFRLFGNRYYYLEIIPRFRPEILQTKEGYFDGYWQSGQYFQGAEEMLRKRICFPRITGEQDRDTAERICGDAHSVGVHMRFGDYLENEQLYGNICTKEYYCRALQYVRKCVGAVNVYLFSNDAERAKAYLGEETAVYISHHSEEEGYLDLQLMSMCRHQIIANSSFSWWAAWLNTNKEKIVVAPEKWLNHEEAADVVPDDWKKMA